MIDKSLFDLSRPECSYMFGSFQGDGHLRKSSRSRGSLLVELSFKDKELLEKFENIISFNSTLLERVRDTNFKLQYKSATLKIYSLEFRNIINELGLPYGKKSKNINLPTCKNYSKIDYIRGLVDADGTLGYTKSGHPFIGLCTNSTKIAKFFVNFCNEITGKQRRISRNKRDAVYCPTFFKEDAQIIVSELYYSNSLSLRRKNDIAKTFKGWKRPIGMRKRYSSKRWTEYEDKFILSHTKEESCLHLKRTKKSIATRLWRLKNVENKL